MVFRFDAPESLLGEASRTALINGIFTLLA